MTATFPFFVGCGRSGTTMVRSMFDAHPEMAVASASFFVPGFARRRSQYEQADGFRTDAFLRDLTGHFGFPRLDLDSADVERAVRGAAPTTTADAVRAVFTAYAAHHGKQRYGDKTAMYVMNIDVLADLLPESKFVHILRDGRSVALAYLARDDMGPETVEDAALYWRLNVEAGRRAGRALGPSRYREIRYEDVVEDPESMLRDLCRFVDLEFDPAMLRFQERAASAVTGSAHPEYHTSITKPVTKGLRDWRTEMADGDVALFEALAGPTLSALGYERRHPSPALPVRARAARARVEAGVRRTAHRVSRRLRSLRGR